MKTKIYIKASVVVFLILQNVAWAQMPVAKEVHKKFDASQVEKLIIETKFGDATIKDNGSNAVTVDVWITTDEENAKKAQQVLDRINVDVSLEGKDLHVETNIESNNMGKSSFTIRYEINIPKEKDLVASAKYGNLYIENLTGNGTIDVAYGNIKAENLTTKNDLALELAYGNGDVENVNNALLDIKYSNFNLKGKAGKLTIDSKYSHLKLNDVVEVVCDSKSDEFKVEAVEKAVFDMGYTNLQIGNLSKVLVVESGYGQVKVGFVEEGFERIVVENRYGDVRLSIDENAVYTIDLEGSYCDLNVPKCDNCSKTTDRQNQNVKGVIGVGKPTSSVVGTSNYGAIKITAD